MLRIYVPVTLAVIALIFALLAVWARPEAGAAARWWVGVSSLVIAVGLYVATKRDYLSSLAYMGFLLILLGTLAGLLHRGLLVAGWGVGIGFVAYSHYQRRRPESPEFPNIILRKVVDKELICERDAVQVAASSSLSEEEDLTYLVVYLQNCMNAPRNVTVRIRRLGWGTTPFGHNRPRLRLPWRSPEQKARFPERSEAVLGPAEVGCLRIPVQGPSDWSLNLSTTVSGGGGKRIRHWEAPELSTLFPAWSTVWLEMTGGLWVNLPGCSYAAELPQPTWEVLWQPSSSP